MIKITNCDLEPQPRAGQARAVKKRRRREARAELVSVDRVIVAVRGHRVILAADLARIYRVESRTLNQAVKRNCGRFASVFAVRMTPDDRPDRSGSDARPPGRHHTRQPVESVSPSAGSREPADGRCPIQRTCGTHTTVRTLWRLA